MFGLQKLIFVEMLARVSVKIFNDKGYILESGMHNLFPGHTMSYEMFLGHRRALLNFVFELGNNGI